MDASFLTATRDSYDAIAARDASLVSSELAGKPLDRALLAAFAEWVQAVGGPVADVGCGPGSVTAALRDLGLDAFGVDLSPGMIALARRAHPDLRFHVGSMLALDLPGAALGGLLANYSIIHVPWDRRPAVFAEFHRVLRPGGQLMLVFQIGDDRRHYDEVDGLRISLDWYRQQPEDLAGLLAAAGFRIRVTAVREPDDGAERTPQGYLLAQKPAGPR